MRTSNNYFRMKMQDEEGKTSKDNKYSFVMDLSEKEKSAVIDPFAVDFPNYGEKEFNVPVAINTSS